MTSVQSIRQFVCDRLTVAAQEILGVFEEKAETYEAEIARQRRLLESVLSPQIKLCRTELTQIIVHKEEEVHLSLQQNPDNVTTSSLEPSHPQQIKEELEEACVTPQKQQLAQKKDNHAPPACEERLQREQSKPLDPDQSATHKDLQPSVSNKYISSESVRESSAVSAPISDHQLLFHNSHEAGGQDQNNSNAESATTVESMSNSNGKEGNSTSGTSAEPTPDKNCDNKTTRADAIEPRHENTTLRRHNKTAPEKKSIGESTASATSTAPTLDKRCNKKTAEGIEPHNENLTLNRQSNTASENKSSEEGTTPATSNYTNTNLSNGDKTSAASAETSPLEKCNNTNTTLGGDSELELHNKNDDRSKKITVYNEKTTNEKQNLEDTTSSKNTETPKKKRANEITKSNGSSEEKWSNKSTKRSTISTRSTRLTSNKKNTEKTAKDAEFTPNEESNTNEEIVNGNSNTTLKRQSSDVRPISRGASQKKSKSEKKTSGQKMDLKLSDRKASSATAAAAPKKRPNSENISTSVEIVGPKLAKRTEPSPKRKPSDRQMTSTVTKKTQSEKQKVGSKTSLIRKESTKNKKTNNGESRSAKSKECTPDKRQNDGTASSGKSSDLPPKKKDKNGSLQDKDNPYKCDMCGKVMTNTVNYKFHMRSHTVEKTHGCEICGKMFRQKWDLNKHMMVHTVDKPFKCDVCSKSFGMQCSLDVHKRVHTGEKPFKCSVCDKRFTASLNMKKHMRIHTGEKPYSCKDCGKKFANGSVYKNHQRVHTGEKPYKCSVCKGEFATATTLKRHMNRHTGEKPFKCSICGKAFGHRSDVKEHERIHTGEKPYKCTTCGDKFSTWLKRHRHEKFHKRDEKSSSSS
ncbi:zinc finger protein 37-like [Cheilinus undulatus]|uniref:zinc finger protein 37-like n=1 Tax=Cheilinus undulatus TaxID=241271 RepID=UPI001BD2D746|nr:zinc finger protein 37-like [Cheilinus undulatus]